ncbi:MAG: hypothetical protein IJ624_01620 [Prevotella sp.]|nr:hypothetical protein [Prevotella sp.]
MNIKKLFMLILALGMGISAFAQFEAGKTYTIKNNNNDNGEGFIQDNGNEKAEVKPANEYSYWIFEATGNENCYYVKNAATGRYLQSYENKSGTEIFMGNTPKEYYIKADASGDYAGKYRLAYTGNEPHDFTSGTLGCNWKNNATNGILQCFASVSGGNPRSAWIITQKDIPPFSIKEGIVYKIKNYKTDDGYVLLKDRRTGTVLVEKGETNAYGLWTFIPTGNEDCWYMKNVLTGNYVQSTKGNEVEVAMRTTPVEIKVKKDTSKGNIVFGFASTDQNDVSFSSNTMGLNWKKVNNDGSGTGQGFAAALGGNPRSFWNVTEVPVISFTDTEDNSSNIATSTGDGKNPIVARSLMSGMWNTLVVPFNISSDDIIRNFGENAAIAELDSETDDVMHFKSTESIVAGKPYLVLPTINVVSIITMNNSISSTLNPAVGETYDFVGVYDKTSIGSDDYFLAADNKLKKNTNDSGQLKPFRAYFKAKDVEAKGLIGFDIDGETTGIIGIDGTVETNVKAYNLNGQKVNPNTLQKGIYIINGKKIINK